MSPLKALGVVLICVAVWIAVSGGGGGILAPSGPRVALAVRETADVTPAMARMTTALRAGEPAKYFKEKGHTLVILDKDEVGSYSKFAPFSTPELLIISPPDTLLHREKLPDTAEGVLSVLKANGG